MRLVIFEAEPREKPEFDRLADGHALRFEAGPLKAANAASFADAEAISTFIYSELGRPVLEQLPALRLIATRSTGYDHIDTDYCAQRGITVCNVPSYGENTVAEHVFALLLGVSHRLPEAVERARSGHFSPEGLEGFDLAGKTIGVIGTGAIGRHVVRIARGFGMEVLGYDAFPDAATAAAAGFRYVGLDELLRQSDIVSLHVPATPETHHMIGERAFALMKPGAVLINTARGSVVDSRALIEALTSGRLAGAGLDVLPDEPLIREEAQLVSSLYAPDRDLRDLVANHILLRLPNVVVTPHSGFNTREAVHRIVTVTVENIAAFLSGKPRNVVAGPERR